MDVPVGLLLARRLERRRRGVSSLLPSLLGELECPLPLLASVLERVDSEWRSGGGWELGSREEVLEDDESGLDVLRRLGGG